MSGMNEQTGLTWWGLLFLVVFAIVPAILFLTTH